MTFLGVSFVEAVVKAMVGAVESFVNHVDVVVLVVGLLSKCHQFCSALVEVVATALVEVQKEVDVWVAGGEVECCQVVAKGVEVVAPLAPAGPFCLCWHRLSQAGHCLCLSQAGHCLCLSQVALGLSQAEGGGAAFWRRPQSCSLLLGTSCILQSPVLSYSYFLHSIYKSIS
mgnify:CR=1 FL=1